MSKAAKNGSDRKREPVDFPDDISGDDYVGDESELLDAEVATIEGVRGIKRSQFFGVAFSGGGIRSGVFCLGVMQKLAASGIFKHVDYLSTVSGGGYIGSALAWWLSGKTSREQEDTAEGFDAAENLPWGTSDPKECDETDNPILTHLRENGNYLVPGNGITLMSGIGVVLRAVLLNLLVWIPIAGAIFIAMHWMNFNWPVLASVNKVTVFGTAPQFTAIFKICLLAAVVLALVYLALSVHFSLLSWSRRSADRGAEKSGNEKHSRQDARKPGDRKPGTVSKILAAIVWLLIAAMIITGGSLISSVVGVAPILTTEIPAVHGYFEFLHLNLGIVILVLSLAAVLSLVVSIRGNPAHNKGAVILCLLLLGLFAIQLTVVFPRGDGHSVQAGSRVLPFILVIISAMLVNYRLGRVFRRLCRVPSVSTRYSGRRSFEKWAGLILISLAALLVIGTLPLVHFYIYQVAGEKGGGITGLSGVLAGALSAFWGFYQSKGKGGGGSFTGPILKFGAAALLFGLAILSFDVAGRVSVAAGLVQSSADYIAESGESTQNDAKTDAKTDSKTDRAEVTISPKVKTQDPMFDEVEPKIVQAVFWSLFVIAVVTGMFANLNYISLGRFYRDRLVEAFMPDRETTAEDQPGAAGLADQLKLSDVWRNRRGPYPLINTNVVLANSKIRKVRQRGGASFILSPFMCGSDVTGWLKTDKFDDNEMTLATAMAISGAAANPRAGVGGKGITRSKTVSLVMNLLNFRLGYWVNNPKERDFYLGNIRPNHFFPSGYYAVTGGGYSEDSKFSELSDGGHFENLGLYELVRRRCRLIIVCDGGQDNSATYSDFVTAIRRIEADFGAKITFGDNTGPENMIAKPREGLYPSGADYSDKGYFVAKVDYGAKRGAALWAREGLIIYMKTTMIKELSMKAKGYKGANVDFPDQSTGDQFFDEEQFEAYRELGYRIAEQAVDELELDVSFKKGRPLFDHKWVQDILKCAANKPATNDIGESNAETPLSTNGSS